MSDENNESPKILKKIDKRLRRLERDLKTSSEDQLFFALVFPLAVLFITIPLGNLIMFFQDFAKLTPELATSAAESVRNAGIICLVISSAVRYYGAVVSHVHRSKMARVVSLELIIMAWDAFLFIVVILITFNSSNLLGAMTIAVAILASLTIFICMTWVEKRILKFYASRFLIFKKDVTPFVSSFFVLNVISLYADFLVLAVLVSIGVVPSEYLNIYLIIGWILLLAVLSLIDRSLTRKKVK